jgi:hypothetical protein
MSRLNRLSAAAIKAMFSSETDEQLIMLIEIEDPIKTLVLEYFSDSNEIRLNNAGNLNIDDNLVFDNLITSGLVANTTYYIVDIDYSNNRIKLASSPKGNPVNVISNSLAQVGGENPSVKRLIRIADSWIERLSYTTTEEVIYGVKSIVSGNIREFIFIPVEVQLPQETESGETSCRLVFNYVTPEMIELIRTNLTKPAAVKIELVLGSNPGIIEAEFTDFFISNVSYNASQITFELSMVPFSREPFPAYNFTPLYFPGLF